MGQPRDPWIAQTYDALAPDLYRLALVILADSAPAEDAVHQAFIRLLSRGRLDDLVSARAFLRTVVRHEAYRLLERRVTQEQANPNDTRLLETANDAAEQTEERLQLENAMRQLTPDQREVLHLKLWDDLTFAQIADFLGIPMNTAASRYRYALERLREILPSPRI